MPLGAHTFQQNKEKMLIRCTPLTSLLTLKNENLEKYLYLLNTSLHHTRSRADPQTLLFASILLFFFFFKDS